MVSVSSFNNIKESYHPDDKGFDFMKYQKGELTVKVLPGDVYICNQTCFVDWCFLLQNMSPVFTKIVIVEKANGQSKLGIRALGSFETITHALGIRFPDIVTEHTSNIFYSIKELREAGILGGRRPVVIMPEGSKTNGLGILNIEKEMIKMITQAADTNENLRVHSVRFDHVYKYFSPYNSYDENGWKLFFGCLQ